MEAKIIKLSRVHGAKTNGKTVRATLACPKCGAHYTFTFHVEDAGIEYEYKAEEIAQAYVKRCAPARCGSCMMYG